MSIASGPGIASLRYPEGVVADKALDVVCSRYFNLLSAVREGRVKVGEKLVRVLFDWLYINPQDPLGSTEKPRRFFRRHRQKNVEPLEKFLVWIAHEILSHSRYDLLRTQGAMICSGYDKDFRKEALQVLLYFGARKELFQLRDVITENDLEVIKDWAFKEYCEFGERVVRRIPETLEEAACGDSCAGQMYFYYKMYLEHGKAAKAKNRTYGCD